MLTDKVDKRAVGKGAGGPATTGGLAVFRDSVTILNGSSNSNGPDSPDSPIPRAAQRQRPRFTSVLSVPRPRSALFEKLLDDNRLRWIFGSGPAGHRSCGLDHFRGTVTLIAAAIASMPPTSEWTRPGTTRCLGSMRCKPPWPIPKVNVSRAASVPTEAREELDLTPRRWVERPSIEQKHS